MSAKPTSETPFVTQVERRGAAVIVRLCGSCSMNESGRLMESMIALAGEGVKLIIVDMAKLDFIESTGLGGIIAGYLRVRRHQGEVRLVSPKPAILHLLELTRLTQLFHTFKTIDEALVGA